MSSNHDQLLSAHVNLYNFLEVTHDKLEMYISILMLTDHLVTLSKSVDTLPSKTLSGGRLHHHLVGNSC